MAALTGSRLRQLLPESSILLDQPALSRDEAIRSAGAVLVAVGAVQEHYVDAMIERDSALSTYVGEGIAMPHGTLTAKDDVLADALVLLRFDTPIDWAGDEVSVLIGIAARGRGYVALLSRLAGVLLDPENARALRAATSADDVYRIFDASHP